MAVFPTPASPRSTGLFFVRRESISMVRLISSSRPMTGSSFPSLASAVRSTVYLAKLSPRGTALGSTQGRLEGGEEGEPPPPPPPPPLPSPPNFSGGANGARLLETKPRTPLDTATRRSEDRGGKARGGRKRDDGEEVEGLSSRVEIWVDRDGLPSA